MTQEEIFSKFQDDFGQRQSIKPYGIISDIVACFCNSRQRKLRLKELQRGRAEINKNLDIVNIIKLQRVFSV